MKSKKPTKEVLEADLKSGLPLLDIAKKHDSSITSVHNWIKAYGLQGIKGEEKPKKEVARIMPILEEFAAVVFGSDTELTDELIATVDDMAQQSPTLAEIEHFHTDVPVQELPKVEMEQVTSGFSPVKPIDLPGTLAGLDLSKVEPIGMTEEENMTDAEWEAQNPIEPTWTQDEWESTHKEKWEGDSVGPAPSTEPFAEVW